MMRDGRRHEVKKGVLGWQAANNGVCRCTVFMGKAGRPDGKRHRDHA